ncbi:transposase [Baaleninema simplex]
MLYRRTIPNAQIVVDRFHVMKAVNDNLNKIRVFGVCGYKCIA